MTKSVAFLGGTMLHFDFGKENIANYSICISIKMTTCSLPLCKWRNSLIFYSVLLPISEVLISWEKCFLSKTRAVEESDNLAVCLAADNIIPIVLKPLWNVNEMQQKIRNWADFTHHQWFHITKQQSKPESHSWKEIPVTSMLAWGDSTPSKMQSSPNCSGSRPQGAKLWRTDKETNS